MIEEQLLQLIKYIIIQHSSRSNFSDDFLKNTTISVRTLRWNLHKHFLLMSVSEFLPTHDQSYLTDADTQTENKNSKFHSDTVTVMKKVEWIAY